MAPSDYVPALLVHDKSFYFRKCNTCKEYKLLYSQFAKRYYKKLKSNGNPRRIKYTFRAQCIKCYNAQRARRRRMKNSPFASMIQSIKVSRDLNRSEIFELGRRAPYFRFISFPVHTDSPNKNGDCL